MALHVVNAQALWTLLKASDTGADLLQEGILPRTVWKTMIGLQFGMAVIKNERIFKESFQKSSKLPSACSRDQHWLFWEQNKEQPHKEQQWFLVS